MQRHWISPRPAPYQPVWEAMQAHTRARTPDSPDQIWLGEHEPVYTLGLAGRREHLLDTGAIPVVATDRGGQVTYHGPGQVMAYVLFDLRRAGYFVREYVHRLESAVIETLDAFGVAGARREPGAPGVYVPRPDAPDARTAKIAALGIKVSNGCTYHGVSLNVAMDLAPFAGINPCGYAGLATVDMAACGVRVALDEVGERLADAVAAHLATPVRQA